MSIFASAPKSMFRNPSRRAVARDQREEKSRDDLQIELQAALAREQLLLQDRSDQSQAQILLVQEFEHRLVNGLQLIASLLSLQSRQATPEAAAQLEIAARRVAAFGRVHRRLHLLDHEKNVEFKQYLQHLCVDLSGLLFQNGTACAITVEGDNLEIPTALGIPLGLIVNELITNAAKYAHGNIVVRFETTATAKHVLSVMDEGPGLPEDFDPAKSHGLGMKIVMSLVRQIGGALDILPGEGGRGTRFTVAFGTPQVATAGA